MVLVHGEQQQSYVVGVRDELHGGHGVHGVHEVHDDDDVHDVRDEPLQSSLVVEVVVYDGSCGVYD